MGLTWLRVDGNHRGHPKFRRGGFWCACVVETCWWWAIQYRPATGEVTLFWDPRLIQDASMWPPEHLHEVEPAMEAAVRFGLIDRHDDGRLFIHDWHEHQPVQCESRSDAALRMRDLRARRRGEASQTMPTHPHTSTHPRLVPPPSDSPGQDIQDKTGQDARTRHTERSNVFAERSNMCSNSSNTFANSSNMFARVTRTHLAQPVTTDTPATGIDPSLSARATEFVSYFYSLQGRTDANPAFHDLVRTEISLSQLTSADALESAKAVAAWAFNASETWANGGHWREILTTPDKFWAKWPTLVAQFNRKPQPIRGEPVHRVTGITLTSRKAKRGDE